MPKIRHLKANRRQGQSNIPQGGRRIRDKGRGSSVAKPDSSEKEPVGIHRGSVYHGKVRVP